MYVAADKFDIPRLQELAMSRIKKWLDNNYMSTDFAGIIQELWIRIPRRANKSRESVVASVATRVCNFLSHGDADAILIGNPDLAVAVLKRVAGCY